MTIDRQRLPLITFYFMLYASFGFLAPYIGLFLERRDWSGSQIGLALFGLTAAGFVGQFLFGFAADRFRCKRLMMAALAAASAVIAMAWPLATGIWLMGLIVVLGLVHRPLVPLMDSATFDHLGGQDRDTYSLFRVGGSIGFLAASIVTSVILFRYFELPVVFVAFAVVMGVAALLPAGFRRGRAEVSEAPFTLSWVADPRIVAVVAMMFLLEFASTGVQGYLGIYIDRFYDLPDAAIPMAWSVGLVSELALFLLAPFVLRRLNLRTVLVIAAGSAALRYLILSTDAATGSAVVFFASQLLHGVYYSIFFAAALGYLDRCSPVHLRASVLATSHAFSTLAGLLLGYLVNGWMLDVLGLRVLFATSGIIAAVGVALLFVPVLSETRQRLGALDDAPAQGAGA
jgi:PPP family 3-phenylpropionic acid transporter